MKIRKRDSIISALLETTSITKAAEKLGITRQTLAKYMEDVDLLKELQKRQKECVDASVRSMQNKLESVNAELFKIIENPKTAPQVKVNAINSFYLNLKQMHEMATTETALKKLNEIEKSLGEK